MISMVVNGVEKQVSGPESSIATMAQQALNTANSASSTANALNTLVGNTPLPTTAQTVTGAIEEVKNSIPVVTGALKAIGTHRISITSDGTKTIGQVIYDLRDAVLAYIADKDNAYRFYIVGCGGGGITSSRPSSYNLYDKTFSAVSLIRIYMTSSACTIYYVDFAASAAYRSWNGTTVTEMTNNSSTAGEVAFDIYEYEELA